MAYSAPITRKTPTLFVFLIDQSVSMSDSWVEGTPKSEKLAEIMNELFHSLIDMCDKNNELHNYYDLVALAYGNTVEKAFVGDLHAWDIVTIQDLHDNPLTDKESPSGITWIAPCHTKGGTNMLAAFEKAKEIVDEWNQEHQDSFPATIFNITDGEYTTGSPVNVIQEIQNSGTNDGGTLVWNLHIGDSKSQSESCIMPTSDEDIKDGYAKELYKMSSVLPHDSSRMTGLKEGARAFAFNANVQDFLDCLRCGTGVDR